MEAEDEMEAENERNYVDPSIEPGDKGTEPWSEGDDDSDVPAEHQDEGSPADEFTGGKSAGMDHGSADDPDAGLT